MSATRTRSAQDVRTYADKPTKRAAEPVAPKHADRTYPEPCTDKPRRGIQPPSVPSLAAFSMMDAGRHRQWAAYAAMINDRLGDTIHSCVRIGDHIFVERQQAMLPDKETADELTRRAADYKQWVPVRPDSDISVNPDEMDNEFEVRCCNACLKRDHERYSDSYRLYGTRICIGFDCYVQLKVLKKVPVLTKPTKYEFARARELQLTDDPFIAEATGSLDSSDESDASVSSSSD